MLIQVLTLVLHFFITTFSGSAVARRLVLDVLNLQREMIDEEFVPTIIGGEPVTNRNQAAYMARLSLCSFSCYHICGAVVVHARYLMSAGHCMFYPATK
jgi:secreted trypsin-like serine protease